MKNFAKSYYTWENSKEAIEKRTASINEYLTKELQDLNVDTIRTDIPTSSTVRATYTVAVHVDADGNMVITKNPTLAPAHQKSTYEPKVQEADGTVDAETMTDATAFLETFFKLYPTATEKELAYYVAGNALEPINGDYLYSELINPIFSQDGENVKVSVSVKFLDNQTKATQISQFELVLHKDGNWKIVG